MVAYYGKKKTKKNDIAWHAHGGTKSRFDPFFAAFAGDDLPQADLVI